MSFAPSDISSKPRPAIPVVLYCAASFWIGTCAGFCLVGLIGTNFCLVLSISLALVLLVICAIALVKGWRGMIAGFVVLFAAMGVLLASVETLSLETMRTQAIELSGETFTFRILEDASEGTYGSTVLAQATYQTSSDDSLSFKVRITLNEEDLTYGDEFRARAVLTYPSDTVVSYYSGKGIALRAKLSKIEMLQPSSVGMLAQARASFVEHVNSLSEQGTTSEDALALISAIVVGDRSTLFNLPLYQDVKATGLAHLVAVSGAHLVIVLGFVRIIMHAFHVPKRLSLVLQVIFLALYLVSVGLPISCIRAACMTLASLLAFAVKRRSHALSSVAVVAIVFIILDPTTANSISFALSALSTLGIVLFMPLFMSWAPGASRRMETLFIEPVAMTFAALLLTFPVSIAVFSQFPFISPVSNVVAAPFVTALCGLGTLAFACMPVPGVCDVLLWVVYLIAQAFIFLLDGLMLLPGINAPVYVPVVLLVGVCVVAAIALWVFWPRRFPIRIAVICALMFVVAFLPLTLIRYSADEIVMLDVGQGDAFLIRSDGATMLVDTGNQSTQLLAALARQGITHIDALLITHADDDHCGCIEDLRGIVSCNTVFIAKGMSESEDENAQDLIQDASNYVSADGVREISEGDTLTCGAFSMEVISPDVLEDDGGNADSICFILNSDVDGDTAIEWRALFCGDAEAEVLNELVDEGLLEEVDIYKVGHHGALAALNEDLAEILSPKLSLISVGANNTYGHPRQEVIDLLEAQGSQVFRSDQQGDVTCTLRADAIEVSTLR